MHVYWLSALPLGGAVAVALLRRWRVPMVIVGLATVLGWLRLSAALPLGQAETFVQQQWLLDANGQRLLAYAGLATMVLLAIAATNEQASATYAPVLASLGLLSAALVLQSWLLSLLVLPSALIVAVLATFHTDLCAPHGAAQFLAWATLPIPFLLPIPWLLGQLVMRPQELAVVTWSAWLVLPAWVLWLNLFPFNGATPLWATGGAALAPAFQWVVKDAVVIYLLMTVWRQMPALQMQSVLDALHTLGMLTALFSGIWAVIQSSVGGVLGCAAMAVLGLVVQGVAAETADGLSAAVFLLVGRSAAVLLSASALAPLYSDSGKPPANSRPFPWQGALLWVICIAGVLAMLRLPVLNHPASGQSTLGVLQTRPGEPRLGEAWRISSAGILIGLAHTSWRLWRERVRTSAGRIRPVPFLVAVCLLILCLYLALSPHLLAGWIAGLMVL